ncbi:hypothetical protein Tco_0540074 [Tanacetum coccineum]
MKTKIEYNQQIDTRQHDLGVLEVDLILITDTIGKFGKAVKVVFEEGKVGGAMTDMSGGGNGGRRSVKVESNGGGQSGDGLWSFLKAIVLKILGFLRSGGRIDAADSLTVGSL